MQKFSLVNCEEESRTKYFYATIFSANKFTLLSKLRCVGGAQAFKGGEDGDVDHEAGVDVDDSDE